MTFDEISPDVRRTIFNLCDDPATTSLVCKQWRKDTQDLIYEIGISATNKIMTWGLKSLIRNYKAILPKGLNENKRKAALIFRRIVLRQDDEFQWLFTHFMNVHMKYPKIPSISEFIQVEDMITAMNDISFCRYTFESIFNGHNEAKIGDEYTSHLLAILSCYTSYVKGQIQGSFDEVYQMLLKIDEFNSEQFQLLEQLIVLRKLPIHWSTGKTLPHLFRMTRISDKIGKLQNIKSFKLCNQLIRFLPEEFKKLKGIIKLDLKKNKLNEISESIEGLEQLRWIDITDNPLTAKERAKHIHTANKNALSPTLKEKNPGKLLKLLLRIFLLSAILYKMLK